MNKLNLILILSIFTINAMAQDLKVKVWPDGAPIENKAPGEEKWDKTDIIRISNITEAELYVYLPEESKNTGAAVVICPGGGYWIEAFDHEGTQIAEFLKEKGVAGIVLKYRLPYGDHRIPLMDAQRAIRIVRSKAEEWKLDPNKIGIAGSSAGGHLASTAGTKFDMGDENATDPIAKVSCRPDFMLLLYPVVTFKEEWGHMGSRKNLIGAGNDWKMVKRYSNELHVTKNTPPTFFVLADDDKGVPPRNSVEFYLAMKEKGVPAEMHIFSKGGHGFGMRKTGLPAEEWPELFYTWLVTEGIATK